MSKVLPLHLERTAYIYVRQSTQTQVHSNLESQRRQYALEQKARDMGWKSAVVVDEDLGTSASGSAQRMGFEQMLAAVCKGLVGAVFAVEASRLARNGREWHTLLELCGLMQTLIVDHDGIYDPRHPNDRLLLGMKGTVSEMELALIWQRSHEALEQKAHRGELLTTVAIGYVKTTDDRVEKDPDRRIQEAIALVFSKFRELGSVRQVLLWYRQEKLPLPCIEYPRGIRQITWKLPVYNTVHKILTNPIYAGAYVYGRTFSQMRLEDGKKRVSRGLHRPEEQWPVLLKDHHEAYVGWEDYQLQRRLIAENANMKGLMARGSVKRGSTLLSGLLLCGHCGRRLHVYYSGTHGTVARYGCRGAAVNHGTGNCINLGALKLDRVVEEAVLEVLSPLGIEASFEAAQRARGKAQELRGQKELALAQARYEAERARRQYDLIDPENRLVAAELERRWEQRLAEARTIEQELAELPPTATAPGDEELRSLETLGKDLPLVWRDAAADITLKKRIVRLVVKEIVVTIEQQVVKTVVHWVGGDHTCLSFRKNRSGNHRWSTDAETERLVRELARVAPDGSIARILNRMGRTTAHGHTWTGSRVTTFRHDKGIAIYRHGEMAERGECVGQEAAAILNINRVQLYKLIKTGDLPGTQCCKGAPWVIRIVDVEALRANRLTGRHRPSTNAPCIGGQKELSLGETST